MSTAYFVDTHVHFHFAEFDGDREAAIERARSLGVRYFLNVGTDLRTTETCIGYARRFAGFFASAGYHPHDAAGFEARHMDRWIELAGDERVVAVGEVGLDYFRDLSPRTKQEGVFRAACEVARKTDKPLILHVREAFPDVFRVLKSEFPSGWQGVFHCFSGDSACMRTGVEMGFHISFAGPLTYKKNLGLRNVAAETPAERILLETDAPFLPPESRRGKRNESALMLETAECLAKVRGVPLGEAARVTTENACRLFRLPYPPAGETN